MIKIASNAVLYLIILGLSFYVYKLNGDLEDLKNSIEIIKTTNEATSKILLEKLQQNVVPQVVTVAPQVVTVVETSVELKRDFLKYILVALSFVAVTGGFCLIFNGFTNTFFFNSLILYLNLIFPSLFINETVMHYNNFSLKVVTNNSDKIIEVLIKLKDETSYKTIDSTINHLLSLHSNDVINEIACSVVVNNAEIADTITRLADTAF